MATVSMLAQRAFRVVLIDVQAVDSQLARLRAEGLPRRWNQRGCIVGIVRATGGEADFQANAAPPMCW